MAIKRVVSTSFWNDDKVVEKFTPEDRYFMLYLMTNPHTTQLGIYELPKRVAGFELGYSTESIEVLLDRFETKYGIIKRSKQTNEIAILNYLAYSVVKGGQPVLDCLNKELKSVKDKSLINSVINKLKERNDLLPTVSSFIDSITPVTELTKTATCNCCNNCKFYSSILTGGMVDYYCQLTGNKISEEYNFSCEKWENL